ncbi:MAG: DUF998 domain-containing protein [Candidatus Bathyarchaeota archaeon]|nr:DUF998 domain-containing protein [Candidatus Bathyarchaeota archaeon]MDW8040109.1 DUF998 domain-containing protein [Nitrososphaerota archaeon]
MKLYDGKVAGALIFAGAVQFILGMLVAECLYPGYSVSKNYISDLGVGATAPIFNFSVFLLGAMVLASAYFLRQRVQSRTILGFLSLCGIGAMGVGIFPENSPYMLHTVFALIAFLFGALSAIASYKVQKPPLSYFAVILGLTALVALILFAYSEASVNVGGAPENAFYLGLGKGGLERMIAYPVLLWAIGFGGYLTKE